MALREAILDAAPPLAAVHHSDGRPSEAELTRALRRVAELEAELQRLRETGEPASSESLANMRLREVEGLLVRRAMESHQGNVSRAARALGLSRSALYRRLERHKI
jgi:transcriptional regulator of acetoin/glycerol metabolism